MAIRIAQPETPLQADIANRAFAVLGAPFRLHGRSVDIGLDCVGLVAHAIAGSNGAFDIPNGYRLRGDHDGIIRAFFNDDRFCSICGGGFQTGDIIAMQPGTRQCHLAVITQSGAVHAHMGLGRAVLTPLPLPWPITGHWRFHGD